MPTAKKLPSGSWRCQVFSHYELIFDDKGKPITDTRTGEQKQRRVYESFTCDDPAKSGKRRAEAMAAEFADKREKKSKPLVHFTFKDALDRYIQERSQVLSPASVRKYKSMQHNCMVPLNDYKIKDLSQDIIQQVVNTAAINKSPKTVRDMNGLIIAVMNRFYPDLRLQIVLPKKLRPDIYVPSEFDIKNLMKAVANTRIEVPVMLAAFGAMRRGEISAFNRSTDMKNNTIHITKTMVMDDNANWVLKAPKSYAGDRYVTIPEFVIDKVLALPANTVGLTPNDITNQFKTVLKHAGLPHFRFHDLRHYNASIQHALGIPDAYIMQSGGWGNDSVLKEVYRHAIPDVQEKMNNKALDYFNSLQHEMQHETKQPQ